MGFLVRKGLKWAVPASVGAATAYFFDPDRGRARRAQAKDRADAALRRRRREEERRERHAQGVAAGEAARASGHGVPTPADDIVLAQTVKQYLAGVPADIENVTVEVVDGLVTLRGQVAGDDAKSTIEAAVSGTPGVREVRSFLHLPGVAAPNKASAVQAS